MPPASRSTSVMPMQGRGVRAHPRANRHGGTGDGPQGESTDQGPVSAGRPADQGSEATAAQNSKDEPGQMELLREVTPPQADTMPLILQPQLQEIPIVPGQAVRFVLAPERSPESPSGSEDTKLHPQESMDKFWANFSPEYLGKVTRILPEAVPVPSKKTQVSPAKNSAESYMLARQACEREVKRIVRECGAANERYSDSHFDLERDLKITQARDCIDGLVDNQGDNPSDVRRVTDVFSKPQFYSDGAGFDDIIQGCTGDCWLLSAFSLLTCHQQLLENICVIRDEDVGVYGFLFYRDGEWHHTIIDDKLYLRAPAFEESADTVLNMYGVSQRDQQKKYNELFQTGSRALYYAQCRDDNETWVPLLEKALAKAHGGYDALVGGQTGEAIEDLTGGVTTEIYTTNILNKDVFWNNELRRLGKDFVFSAGVAVFREWRSSYEENMAVREQRRMGIVSGHAYAVLDTYEGFGQRLIKMRNPWGDTEWKGPWSDGSSEWTPEWLQRLEYRFGDDGVFWISYEDFLGNFRYVDRTRIFGHEWYTAQQWTSVQVPYSTTDYQSTTFSFTIPEDTDAVIALSQLDTRYFRGLEGKFNYKLQFRIQREGGEDDYIARSRKTYELERSCNVEIRLEKGTYTVLFKVEAQETGRDDPEVVVRANVHRKEKITQLGKLYDLAHQKGQLAAEERKTMEEASKSTVPGMQETAVTAVGKNSAEPVASAAVAETSDVAKSAIDVKDAPVTTPPPAALPVRSSTAAAADPDDPDRKPWNAACVVGLRVYSRQPEIDLKVVLPSAAADGEVKMPVLDGDDVTKAAQDEAVRKSQP